MLWQNIGNKSDTEEVNPHTLRLLQVDRTIEEVMGEIPPDASLKDILEEFEKRMTDAKHARNIPWVDDSSHDEQPSSFHAIIRREPRLSERFNLRDVYDKAHSFLQDNLPEIFSADHKEKKASILPALLLAGAPLLPAFAIAIEGTDIESAESADETATIVIPLDPPEKFYCDADHPYVFRGEKQDHVITRNEMCKRLLQALPDIGKTVQYNASMSVEGLPNGDYQFRLREDNIDITVPRRNYKAIIEAWIVSGGAAQDPAPLTFPFGKWRIESGLGTNIESPGSACGINQFMPGTWAQALDNYGRAHGYGEFRTSIRRIGAKYGNLDYGKVESDYGFRQMFNQYCRNVTMSAVIGIRNSLAIATNLQEKIDSGEIILPEGRTSPSARDVYIAHLLGVGETDYYQDRNGHSTGEIKERTGAVEFFHILHSSPNRSMKSFVDPSHYASNDYFMEEDVGGHKESMSAERFYERFGQRWGFDNRAFPDMRNWSVARFHAAGSTRVSANEQGIFAGDEIESHSPRSNMRELTVYTSAVKISFE